MIWEEMESFCALSDQDANKNLMRSIFGAILARKERDELHKGKSNESQTSKTKGTTISNYGINMSIAYISKYAYIIHRIVTRCPDIIHLIIIRCMKSVAMKKLAQRIKRLRKKCGYTQDQLAELTKIDYKYIQRIEGRNPPALKIDTLERIAKVFRISLSKLLDFGN